MTLKEAIRKTETETGVKVKSVGDCRDRWVFDLDFGEPVLIGAVPCCYKDTGETSWFLPSEEPDVLLDAKPIPLPD